MKSRYALAALTAAAALVLSGCSAGSSAGSSSEKLEFQTNLAVGNPILASLTTVTQSFEAANPGVTIDLVPGTDTYEADMKVRMASGNLPDLWATHGWSLIRYSDFLAPLNDQPWAQNVNPALDRAMKNSQGQFFAYPVDTDVAGIVYNKDVLAKSGIDVSTLTTWDAFTAAAEKIKSEGVTPISSSGKDNWLAGNIADWLAPGAYTDQQLKDLSAGKFEDASYTELLSQVNTWSQDGLFNPDYSSAVTDDIARNLATGQTAFVFTQNAIINNALQFNADAQLGYMPIPSLDGSTPYLVGGEGQAYGAAKNGKNLPTAEKYLAYLAQPENTSALATAAGTIPGLTNATSDLKGLQSSYDSFVKGGQYPLEPYFDRAYMPNGMWDTMVATTDAVITKQGNVSDGVGQVSKQFTTLYGQK